MQQAAGEPGLHGVRGVAARGMLDLRVDGEAKPRTLLSKALEVGERLSTSSTSMSTMSWLSSVLRKCGRINSKSSADSDDKNPFSERGAESKAVSCLTGKAGSLSIWSVVCAT